MNYIKHLNGVFYKFYHDDRLNPSHVCLYMALFQLWNLYRFPKEFYIDRQETMKLAKIGSKSTYHRILTQLDKWNYIQYVPSHNPFKGSKVKMPIFGTTDDSSSDQTLELVTKQVSSPKTNNTKTLENNNKRGTPRGLNEVLDLFEKRNWPKLEGEKFFSHYEATGWMTPAKAQILDWTAAADLWMLRDTKNEQFTHQTVSHIKDNLQTTTDKSYDQPL